MMENITVRKVPVVGMKTDFLNATSRCLGSWETIPANGTLKCPVHDIDLDVKSTPDGTKIKVEISPCPECRKDHEASKT